MSLDRCKFRMKQARKGKCVCVSAPVAGCLSLCVVASSKTSHYALGLCSHWRRAPDLLTKIVW